MATPENTTIIEVNGVKLEVDMRSARRIEEIRIGSPVKVLTKGDYDGGKVYAGVVIGFEPFRELPTILVAYIEDSWSSAEVKVIAINAKQKDYDLVAAADPDFAVDRAAIINRFERKISDKKREIEVIEEQKRYFETNFKAFWQSVQRDEVAS
jgi:hypothetical protein